MKKTVSSLFLKAVKINIKNEAESACAFWGYQPKMPKTAKSFGNIRKKK